MQDRENWAPLKFGTYRNPRVHPAATMTDATETKTKVTLIVEKAVMEKDLDESSITNAETAMAIAPDSSAVR